MQRRVIVIGGGIVGLSVAERLAREGWEARVFEKEPRVAAHQSGRNSGVIHSGVYYKPGSSKARNCAEGRRMLLEFCAEHGIAHEVCGKVIVATDDAELERLNAIAERGQANGVPCEMISSEQLQEREPGARGVAALLVPGAGIVDYPGVCDRLAGLIAEHGSVVRTDAAVVGVRVTEGGVVVRTGDSETETDILVNCAGLHSDRIARMAGVRTGVKIVPFRGEYFMMNEEGRSHCRHLIYPTPDPKFPFLGVHLTRMIHGGVECGPNAVLAMAREGYDWRTLSPRDLSETLLFPGFLRLAARYPSTGLHEIARSLSRELFAKALRKLTPGVRADMLVRADAGVRAQAIARDGSMVDDFRIETHGRGVHVINAPSPAATSSLAIGAHVAGLVSDVWARVG